MIRKIKIGFDAKRLFHNDTGLGNYSRNLVSQLAKHYPQYEIHLFTPSLRITEETRKFTETPYIVHTPKFKVLGSIWRILGVSRLIKNLELDIYHGLSHEIPFNIPPGTKSLVTFHDLIWERYPALFGRLNSWIYHLKYTSSAIRSDRIISISNSTSQDLKGYYNTSSSKISLAYQSCNSMFSSSENPLKLEDREHFLYVGSIIQRKGLMKIIEACGLLKPSDRTLCVVIGTGDEYETKCKLKISELGLNDWFLFVGKKSNEDLIAFYDQAVALLLPSLYEGFGIPVVEALYRSTPVITSFSSSLPEAAGPGALLVNPLDSRAISEAMIQIKDPQIWEELSAKGRVYVQSNFGVVTVTQRLHEIYSELIGHQNL